MNEVIDLIEDFISTRMLLPYLKRKMTVTKILSTRKIFVNINLKIYVPEEEMKLLIYFDS